MKPCDHLNTDKKWKNYHNDNTIAGLPEDGVGLQEKWLTNRGAYVEVEVTVTDSVTCDICQLCRIIGENMETNI